MDEQIARKEEPLKGKIEDRLYLCPHCEKPLIRVGCYAVCKHCGYQEGCGD